MSESQFNQMIDDLLMNLEEQLDDLDVDIDYETAGGVLTLIFENGTQIIINRQTPVRQLWLATRTGGFHFDRDDASGEWHRDTDGAEFFAILNENCSLQAGAPVTLTP
ncbi:MAG: iron donor protein CyaY [Gammaproteobacteria bacterium]|nr:iron donor protein CyaY [Gammaproteobacteria bacterium]